MSSVVHNDLSGITLDRRYTLIRKLGEGAMGQVYIARHEALDRMVAVKLLHPWRASEPRHHERFLQEARAASRIKHPNVVEILDFGSTPEGSVYLVMERLQGRDLKQVLQQEGRLPWPRARHFLVQAVAALAEAHRRGVIHRDIKPANCFVCDPPEPGMPEHMKLLDFGIAKIGEDPGASTSRSAGKRLTQTGELVGTLAYLAPEFADGHPASMHTDMYALGIMAYQLLVGDVPFKGRNEYQVLARHLSEPPVRPRVHVPQVPEAAEKIVLKMLAKNPELRFRSMSELEQVLLATAADAGDRGPVVVPRGKREGSGPRASAEVHRAPPVGRIRQRTPVISLQDATMEAPPLPLDRPIASGEGEHAPARRRGRAADSDDAWALGEPIDFDAPRREEPSPEPKRLEWGTVATIILLGLLSAAAIASVILRQQGIELHELWPWSTAEPEPPPPEPDPEPRMKAAPVAAPAAEP